MIVIGAGVGGLTTAAILAKAGLSVTVLEAHVYPGGCAGTFYHKKYRFDAGATLAGGFYPGGPMDLVAQATGIKTWPARPDEPAMVVHLPDGPAVTRWSDERRWDERRTAFGESSLAFWRWQERTADALWALALSVPPWPPQNLTETFKLARDGSAWLGRDVRRLHPRLVLDAFRPVAAHLTGASSKLRQFVDAQLLIAAQTTSGYTNALYGASALDLPRRGVVHLTGGMGGLAETLAEAVRQNGGEVLYKQEVTRIVLEKGRPVAVETKRRQSFPAKTVIVNLPPWNVASLLGDSVPPKLRRPSPPPEDGWGAFMAYVGLEAAAIPNHFPLHHQVVVREPLAEANSVFISLSPAWDESRAPAGQRAITLSTHTGLKTWWHLFETDRQAYEARKQAYTEKMLAAVAQVLPDMRAAVQLVMPGTPVTFQRFTRRAWGWVGGFPQTHLFRTWAPRLAPHLWLVGDSIFPGQSTAAVALGGIRVAQTVLNNQKIGAFVRQEELGPFSRFGSG
ncbi:MAG TPA: NAD(P)/FAD-dependent oxidoreductase [Anaerolineae bacterium]|nr:NAD(P)/FAD-dependent oxidoreductase [Anaerolineae bacterium]